ncbi:S-layer family protein [Chroococcidiopsis sp. CCMEE 29]|uniref:beta strand repeat-containing protein n=1 Tax=Chroococcidiopsis sp. CCMEE 29 TaxID=155894 RepID=UPI0020216706|nr:S-layer family protein [Chroococcidiopsis sp. CCMEE 29]
MSFPDGAQRSDISLSNGAGIDVTASGGGSIAVNARNLEMTEGSYLFAGIEGGLASENSKAGNIDINATGAIYLNNESMIANQVLAGANGQGGDVNISASSLWLEGGAQINAFTLGAGRGGNLTVNASSEVQLIGTSKDGESSSNLTTSAQPNSTGNAGGLNLETPTLLVRDGAQVGAVTFGAGRGGNLNVVAHDIQLIGTSKDSRFPSGLSVSATRNSTGDAGNLTINTDNLWLEDGAQITAATFGTGRGGNLNVVARDIQLSGISNGGLSSGLFTSTQRNSTGDAGGLTISTDNLLVQDGATVGVQSLGTGTAGNMRLDARSIRLDNNALLTANTQSALVDSNSEQATININSQNLFMSRNSNIFTNAEGENVIGGNININTDFLFAIENSDISANSENFRGGNVRINASGIFGTQFRQAPDDRTSDITASGANPQFSGTVELDVPEIDPNSGLAILPSVPVDTQVARACTPNSDQNQSEFIVTGRGGLPPNPTEVLSSDAILIDWVALQPTTENQSSPTSAANSTAPSPAPIVEATGWEFDRQGKVILTASNLPTQSDNSWQSSDGCKLH